MKRFIFTIAMIMLSNYLFSQSIKRINDPHITAQEKRQVFQQWGDWKPNPKYFLGVQYNVHYTSVWGWMAPSRNQRYRKGSDIRPLSATGLQNQRYASTLAQTQQTKQILQDVEKVYDEAVGDLNYNLALLHPTDPLYILYYRRMLSPLEDFPTNSNNYRDWGFEKPTTMERLARYGVLERLKQEIITLQDNYANAKSMDMPRGKRLLMYHDCLLAWRKQKKYLDYLNAQGNTLFNSEIRQQARKNKDPQKVTKARRDAEILADILMESDIK